MCRTDRDPAKVTSSTKYPPFRGPIMPQPSLSSRRSWSAGQSFYAGSWIPQVTLAIFFALMRSDGGDMQQQLRPRSEATPCTNLLNPTGPVQRSKPWSPTRTDRGTDWAFRFSDSWLCPVVHSIQNCSTESQKKRKNAEAKINYRQSPAATSNWIFKKHPLENNRQKNDQISTGSRFSPARPKLGIRAAEHW